MRERPFAEVLLFACFVPAILAAQTLPDDAHSIDEVEVHARKADAVIDGQTLSGQQMEALRHHSVADAMRYFSGVQLKDYGGVGGMKTVNIRSMGSNHLGVFYDGIQLGNAQNGIVDLGKYSMDNLEEITLYNGQKSGIFQPAKDFGSSGTLYLRSRRPLFMEDERDNVKVTARGGSFGMKNIAALWEHKWSRRVTSSISAEFTDATGKYPFRYRRVNQQGKVMWDTTAVRRNGDIQAERVEAYVQGNVDDGMWNVKAYFYNSKRGIPGAIVNNVWKHSQRQWDRNFFVQSHSQKAWMDGRLECQWNVKYAWDKMRYLNPDTTLRYVDNTFRQHEVYASMATHFIIWDDTQHRGEGGGRGKWDVGVSADYQWNGLDGVLQGASFVSRHTVLVAGATSYEIWRAKVMASVLGTFVRDHMTDATNECTPSVFLSVRPLKRVQGLEVTAFYKKIFRMPTFNDLYYTDMGNKYLKPEYTTQYDVGIAWRHDWMKGALRHIELKAEAYYNQVDNKIVAIPKGNSQYRWMMMNLGYVEIRGAEMSFKTDWRMGRSWALEVGGNYTYQKAQDFSNPKDNDPEAGTYGGQIAYIPWHAASAMGTLTWVMKKNMVWNLNYSYIYTGKRYHTSSNIPVNFEQPWYTHDLSLRYALRLKKVRLAATLEVNNLFDQQYDVILNYPMPGRNFKGILSCEF